MPPSAWTICSASDRGAPVEIAPTCWVVTDGKAGMESQCLGLAEALGLTPVVKRVALRAPWRQLSPYLRLGQTHAFAPSSDPLQPPWPDLLIATGRHSIAASLVVHAASRRAGRATVTVQLQDPKIAPAHFDLVVAPHHDALRGANVLSTHGALHRITPALLADAAERLAPEVAHLPRPYVAVLVGGSNAAYRFGPADAATLARQLAAAVRPLGGSLLVTPSRRTSAESLAALRTGFADIPHLLWDGQGVNPYFGFLGTADFIVVTGDSVNMVSEAVATGKPVYVAHLPGGSARFARFHRLMEAEGLTRPFAGILEPYAYAVPDDLAAVAARVRALLAAGRGNSS